MSRKLHALAEVTELLTDGTHYTPRNVGKGVPFLTVKDVSEAGLDFEKCSRISQDEFDSAKKQNSAPRRGDVLFSKDGTVGKVHLVREAQDFAVLSSLAILRPNAKLLPDYLAHFLRSPDALDAATKKKTGSAIRRIVLRDLASLQIPLPPLDEQKRIAAILDKADQLRKKRRQANDLLHSLSSSLIEEIVKETSGRSISLGDCLSFVTSGGRNWSRYYAEDGARFIRSLDVQMNFIGNEDVVFVQAPDNAEARRTRTESGDVLLTITGSRIGRVAALSMAEANSYVSQHVAILRPTMANINSEFLSFFLSSSAGQRQIAKWQYGQTKPGLNFDQIRSFEIPDVSKCVQEEFVSKVRAIVRRSEVARHQENLLDALFASLQHRAFAGQL